MAVPYTFGTATTSIPLSQLDSNFATTITLGNTAIQLGNTVTTLNNMTMANVTVSSAATPVPEAAGGTGTTIGYNGFKNRIINGAMAIFQRGTAATTNLAYSVDRWRYDKGNDATESVSQNTDAPTGFSYSLRNTISVGDATIGSAQFSSLQQAIEGYNVADLGWGTANAKPVTLSFWVRSSVTGQYVGNVRNSDDTRINPFNFTINAANTWEQKTVTITGDTGGTWNTTNGAGIQIAIYAALGSSFLGGTSGTWGTNPNFGCGSPVNGIASNGNIFAITGVQLEKGSTATSFDYRPYGTELALCQRYYEKSYSMASIAGASTNTGKGSFVTATGNVFWRWTQNYRVSKRADSSFTIYSTTGASGNVRLNNASDLAVLTEDAGENATAVYVSRNATVGDFFWWQWTASAEL